MNDNLVSEKFHEELDSVFVKDSYLGAREAVSENLLINQTLLPKFCDHASYTLPLTLTYEQIIKACDESGLTIITSTTTTGLKFIAGSRMIVDITEAIEDFYSDSELFDFSSCMSNYPYAYADSNLYNNSLEGFYAPLKFSVRETSNYHTAFVPSISCEYSSRDSLRPSKIYLEYYFRCASSWYFTTASYADSTGVPVYYTMAFKPEIHIDRLYVTNNTFYDSLKAIDLENSTSYVSSATFFRASAPFLDGGNPYTYLHGGLKTRFFPYEDSSHESDYYLDAETKGLEFWHVDDFEVAVDESSEYRLSDYIQDFEYDEDKEVYDLFESWVKDGLCVKLISSEFSHRKKVSLTYCPTGNASCDLLLCGMRLKADGTVRTGYTDIIYADKTYISDEDIQVDYFCSCPANARLVLYLKGVTIKELTFYDY